MPLMPQTGFRIRGQAWRGGKEGKVGGGGTGAGGQNTSWLAVPWNTGAQKTGGQGHQAVRPVKAAAVVFFTLFIGITGHSMPNPSFSQQSFLLKGSNIFLKFI